MKVTEGKERKGGTNPPPLHPKPNLSPPGQGTRAIVIECKTCHKNYYYKQEHKHLEHDIIEVGTLCPHCGVWHRVAYFNEDLIERQKGLKNNRQRRAFRRDLGLFQMAAVGLLGVDQGLQELSE